MEAKIFSWVKYEAIVTLMMCVGWAHSMARGKFWGWGFWGPSPYVWIYPTCRFRLAPPGSFCPLWLRYHLCGLLLSDSGGNIGVVGSRLPLPSFPGLGASFSLPGLSLPSISPRCSLRPEDQTRSALEMRDQHEEGSTAGELFLSQVLVYLILRPSSLWYYSDYFY